MQKETVISTRPDREIRKRVIKPGDYTLVPYEDSRCKITLSDVKCSNEAGPCEIDPYSRIFSRAFDGNVLIGDCDSFIDKDFELVLQAMCSGETCEATLVYRNAEGKLMKEITCKVDLKELTEEQLISDWSWERLYEAAVHHKVRSLFPLCWQSLYSCSIHFHQVFIVFCMNHCWFLKLHALSHTFFLYCK